MADTLKRSHSLQIFGVLLLLAGLVLEASDVGYPSATLAVSGVLLYVFGRVRTWMRPSGS